MPGDNELSHSKKKSGLDPRARIIGSSATGIIEALIAFPLDKYKNNRMLMPTQGSPKQKVFSALGIAEARGFKAIRITYNGFFLYGSHKVVGRGLKIGCQGPLMDMIMNQKYYRLGVTSWLGKENSKVAAATISGIMLGGMEVAANWLDYAKILAQKKNISSGEAITMTINGGFVKAYTGWRETGLRNMLGSGSLFLGKFLTYNIIGVTNHQNPSVIESFSSSMIGAALSISLSHLADFAKNRAQDKGDKMGIIKRLRVITQQEGIGVLWEGFFPKLLSSGLKLTLVLTTGDMLMKALDEFFKKEKEITYYSPRNYNPKMYALPRNQPSENVEEIKKVISEEAQITTRRMP